MLTFQEYQRTFTAHIRNPKVNPRPQGVSAKRMSVYNHGVFWNLQESVSACFPVCQQVLGQRRWLALCKLFFAQYASQTPIFREIPEAFLTFLSTQELLRLRLPPFLFQLAHYEWVELAVSALPDAHPTTPVDLLHDQLVFTPHMLLSYDYPVHQISAKYRPKEQISTFLMVYRNLTDEIKFIILNPITFRLLNQITRGNQALDELHAIAVELQHPQPENIVQFGLALLQDLRQQQIILN